MNSRPIFVFVLLVLLVFYGDVISAGESETTFTQHSFAFGYVTDRRQIQDIVDHFRGQLLRSGSNAGIIDCYYVTKMTEEGTGGFGVGAVCTVQSGNNTSAVLMCDDSLARKFTWLESGMVAQAGVVRFLKKNCPPGG